MAHLTDRDIERIAASLSGEHGAFPVSNLVNYGSTIVVRPGARTSQGVVFAGVEVGAMLPCEYVAVPVAVEYGAESGADLLDLDAELGGEIASLAADVLGVASADLRHPAVRARYARVTEKFRFRVSQLRSGKQAVKASSLARAQRGLKRLGKIWKHMGKLGIDRASLASPSTLAAELAGAKVFRPQLRPSSPIAPLATRYPATRPSAVLMSSHARHRYVPHRVAPTVAVASPAPVAPVAAPVAAPAAKKYTPVSKAYLADQAALEREIQSGTPSYFGASDHAVGQEDLGADLRAETIGYLFGSTEHDYFGVAEESFGGLSSGSDVEFTSEDFRALFGRDPGEALVEVFGDADLEALARSGDASAMIDVLGGILESERLAGLADQAGWGRPAYARRFRRLSRQRSNVARLAKVRMESPVVYDGSVVLDEDDDEYDDGILHLGADEFDDEGDEGEGEEGGGDQGDDKGSKPKSTSIDTGHAKAANLQRRALLPSVADVRALGEKGEGTILDRTERAAKLVTQLTDVLRSIAPNGSVNYARLRPVGLGSFGDAGADPVIVIGIQKRTTAAPVDLLEILVEEEVAEPSPGYDASEAVDMVMKTTHVSDYVGSMSRGSSPRGSMSLLEALVIPSTNAEGMNDVERAVYGPVLYGAANGRGNVVSGVAPDAWPNGDAAPLPPPRRIGAEVYGA